MKNGLSSRQRELAEVGSVGVAGLRVCVRRYEVGWCFVLCVVWSCGVK